MKIALISTSPRKESSSLKVARYLQTQFPESKAEDIQLVDFEEIDIPMVGRGSLDKNQLTPFQERLLSTWGKADLVIFTIPEYNWITSGELINALHQVSGKPFAELFQNKVFGLVGVSSGRGGRRPCLEINVVLNKLISFQNQYSVISPKIYESHDTGKNLDENGKSTGNEIYEKGIADFVNYTLGIAKKWHGIQ
ncbi:NADPH-dependent FMN reductase [Arundinibacter roseus]|uniref:NADPH-dependent oxidoreductase n=1 Tax=Arundinibacter roseus TaxID=2070510 RepID=A0A4R4K9Y1_9BACT|nr:NAD(P)H-dependent oxidoreductase [Arundinibacter roseus]TDB63326.1 NADPH-dependent oxidoreductase [Arundinibacter roseus]